MRSFLQTSFLKKTAASLLFAASVLTGVQAFAQAPEYISRNTNSNTGSSSASAVIPAGTEDGNLLIAHLVFEKGGTSQTPLNTNSLPTGWSLIRRVDNGSNLGMAVFYKIAVNGDAGTTVSFPLSNGQKWSISISRITGHGLLQQGNLSLPYKEITTYSNDNSNIAATNVIAPSSNMGTGYANDRLILCFYAHKGSANLGLSNTAGQGGSTSVTTPAGSTNQYTATVTRRSFVNVDLASSMIATFTHPSGSLTPAVQGNLEGTTSGNNRFNYPIAMQLAILPVNPLPVELVSFHALKKATEVALTWETASEQNNTGFEVQASSDGKNFDAVGFVTSKNGNANYSQRYAFSHKNSNKEGLAYYRLKQIDLDGSFKFYSAKVVNLGSFSQSVNTYPNPFRNQFEVSLQAAAAETAEILVTDMTGKTVFATSKKLEKGSNSIQVELNNAPAGIYLLKATTGDQTFTNRLVKQ